MSRTSRAIAIAEQAAQEADQLVAEADRIGRERGWQWTFRERMAIEAKAREILKKASEESDVLLYEIAEREAAGKSTESFSSADLDVFGILRPRKSKLWL